MTIEMERERERVNELSLLAFKCMLPYLIIIILFHFISYFLFSLVQLKMMGVWGHWVVGNDGEGVWGFRVLGIQSFFNKKICFSCFATDFPQFSCFFLHGVLVLLALGLMCGRLQFCFFFFKFPSTLFYYSALSLTHSQFSR